MARPGAKPKPTQLRLVDGTTNVTRHGKETEAREKIEASCAAFSKLSRPKFLRGEALNAWKRYIEPAGWLDGSKEAAAIAFCELWQEFRSSPVNFQASKHSQMRAYMSEIGLTDERNRIMPGAKEKDEFFD